MGTNEHDIDDEDRWSDAAQGAPPFGEEEEEREEA
jgi:hypothetical protein